MLHQSWSTGWKREIAQWVDHETFRKRQRNPTVTTTLMYTSDYQQDIFYMLYPTNMPIHTTAFRIIAVENWLERKIVLWIQQVGLIRRTTAL